MYSNIELSDIERNVCCINQFHVIFINAPAGKNIACFSVELMKENEMTSLENIILNVPYGKWEKIVIYYFDQINQA